MTPLPSVMFAFPMCVMLAVIEASDSIDFMCCLVHHATGMHLLEPTCCNARDDILALICSVMDVAFIMTYMLHNVFSHIFLSMSH